MDMVNIMGHTPLHLACHEAHLAMSRLLLENCKLLVCSMYYILNYKRNPSVFFGGNYGKYLINEKNSLYHNF